MRAALLILLTLTWASAQQPAPAPAAVTEGALTLSGRVLTSAGTPIAGVEVNLAGSSRGEFPTFVDFASTITDASGRFRFDRLAPESYQISAVRPGYVALSDFVTLSGEPGNPRIELRNKFEPRGVSVVSSLDLTMLAEATLNGRLIGEEGEPIRGIEVRLLRRELWGGKYIFQSRRSATTDADGRFSLGRIEPGPYFLLARSSSTIPARALLRRQSPDTYYPGVTSAGEAQPIEIGSGARIQLDDLVLKKIPMALVTVSVVNANGKPADASLSFTREALATDVVTAYSSVSTVAPGTFALPPQLPGRVQLSATSGETSVIQSIDVVASDVHVTLALLPPANARGTVRFEKSDPIMKLTLRSINLFPPGNPIEIKPDGQGKFTLGTIPPGPYELNLEQDFMAEIERMMEGVEAGRTPAPVPYVYARSIKINGEPVLAGTFTLPPESDLEIVIAPGGQIAGEVLDAQGKPAYGATVAIWPVQLAPTGTTPFYVTGKVFGSSGRARFTIDGVPPGEYRILAFQLTRETADPGGFDLELAGLPRDPAFRNRFSTRTTTVFVPENGTVQARPNYIPVREVLEAAGLKP